MTFAVGDEVLTPNWGRAKVTAPGGEDEWGERMWSIITPNGYRHSLAERDLRHVDAITRLGELWEPEVGELIEFRRWSRTQARWQDESWRLGTLTHKDPDEWVSASGLARLDVYVIRLRGSRGLMRVSRDQLRPVDAITALGAIEPPRPSALTRWWRTLWKS